MMCFYPVHRLAIFSLAIILWLSYSPLPSEAQNPPVDSEQVPFDPRFGIVNSYVNTTEANAAGAGWTRVFFRWDIVQSGGPTDWKPSNVPDNFINAEVEAGREIVAVLIGTPPWATESQVSTAVPPLEVWGEFVFKIATQYKGRIKHWVIWNQPDINDSASPNYTWAGSVEDYSIILREAYLKIKAVDPAMQVHIAGLTYTWDENRGQPQFLERLLDVLLADPQAANENFYFDAVSYHLYYDPRKILQVTQDVRRILDSRGFNNKAIWINETNAPPSEDYLEPLTAPALYNITLEEQSAFVIQAMSLALAGGAERVAFNQLRNETFHPESAEPYGLLRGDNSRRPAFNAFQTVTTHFAGVQTASWQQSGSIYVVMLDRAGQTTTVLWNLATAPTTFSINAIAGQALLVDEQGGAQQIFPNEGTYTLTLPGAACTNGSYCFIGGAPRLLVENGVPSQRSIQITPQAGTSPTSTALPPTPTQTPPATATAAALPTLTPTSELIPPTATVLPTITDTPVEVAANPEPTIAADSPPPAALPDPGIGSTNEVNPTTLQAEVPTVSFQTVMTPRRIITLFFIGLGVFTASYVIQVVIWYRIRK